VEDKQMTKTKRSTAMTTMTFECRTFETKGEAVQYSEAAGGTAILLEAEALVVEDDTAEELAAAGVEFAYIIDRDGRLMTIPVND
jgi:hypothetical protein